MWSGRYEFRGTSKPTVNKLYYLLGSFAYRWRELGAALEFKNNKLEEIKADFETSSRCIIELFDVWIESTVDCNWSMVTKALKKLDEASLAEKILHYTQELERVESIPFMKCRKSFCPLKDYCYEDQELKKHYFQTDKLAVAPIINQLDEKIDVEIINCLMRRHINWYEMGIIMGLPKARLDEIEKNNKSLGYVEVLTKMVVTLIQQFSFECTWRRMIDALLDMNFVTVAKELESLALSKCGISNATSRINHEEYRGEDFGECEQGNNKEEVLKNLREVLYLPLIVSDEDLLEKLRKFISIRNPGETELKLVVHLVEEIGQLSSKELKGIAGRVEELKSDLEVKKKVIIKLTENKRELKIRKSTLEDNSREITEEIELNATKAKLTELDRRHQKVMEHLQEVCIKFEKCIQDLEKANADYHAINEELTECKCKLNTCKRQLNACNNFVTESDTQLSLDFKVAISDTLKVMESTSTEIAEVQHILDSPLHDSEPIIFGKGLESAEVNKRSEFRVITQQSSEKPTKQLPIVKCHLKRLSCNSTTECKVDGIKCDEYRVKYKPTARGRHELTVTVNEKEVVGSPFSVFVFFQGKPIATGRNSYPVATAVNSIGQVVVATRKRLLLLSKKGKRLKTFEQHHQYFIGVAVDTTTDNVYAAVRKESLFLMKLSPKLKYLQDCECNISDIQDRWMVGVAVVGDEVMVCDESNSCVKAYTKELKFKRETGKGLKGFSFSSDEDGNLFICSNFMNIITVFKNDDVLRFISAENPVGVSVAGDYLYVTSKTHKLFVLLLKTGQQMISIGENAGSGVGQFSHPSSLFVDTDGFVYVCDTYNNRIQVFNFC